ncbi:MAG TPA: hypothetical protein VFJ57_02005 [Solirubrobacterales bacterium]|nr:hypothetical protein [Solirubrobacterales bacterium]
MRLPSREQTQWIAWALLGAAMLTAALWLMLSAQSTTFSGDDIYYYARYIAHGFAAAPGDGIEYFLAPHNGHLVVVGKLVYRALFEVFGADYAVFRAANLLGVLAAVGLFYVLARRRVGPLLALAPAIFLLFFGYAWESLIWAFDLHTAYALVFGLAALLVLERNGRHADGIACALLVLATATLELGLAFTAGVAVSVLLRQDRWRRCWIFLVPAVLYGIWMIWAAHFDQSEAKLTNVHLIPIDIVGALSSIAGAVTGINPTGPEFSVPLAGITAGGTVLAFIFVLAVAWRVSRGNVPPTLWTFATIAIAYWITIALGDREPDSSRYLFAGTVLVFLVAADALQGASIRPLAVVATFVVLGLALPANVAKYYEGRRLLLNDADATRAEYAMLELAGVVDPGYRPGADPVVIEQGGGVYAALPAADYFRAAAEFGPISGSIADVRAAPLTFREVADATLVHAERLQLQPTSKPADVGDCRKADAEPAEPVYFDLPPGGGTVLGSISAPVEVKGSRFAKDGTPVPIGTLEAGSWATLKAPIDSAPTRWRIYVYSPSRVCE